MHIIELGKFDEEVGQETILLILRKRRLNIRILPEKLASMTKQGIIFIPSLSEKNTIENIENIENTGSLVKTGGIVWNQHKELLSHNPNECGVIIYTQNLNEGEKYLKKLRFSSGEKGQYIKDITKFKPEILPFIVVSRTIGASGNPHIKTQIILPDDPLLVGKSVLVENHLNIIYHSSIDILFKIYNSIISKKTSLYIKNSINSRSFSSSQLKNLPIFD